jgi:hypothetical protein
LSIQLPPLAIHRRKQRPQSSPRSGLKPICYFEAFSSREPVSTSLENALVD